jgi:hypothetical protein
MVLARAESLACDPLQPRNLAVPSYRPRPRSGCTTVCASEGQVRGRGSPQAARGTRAVVQEPERRSQQRPKGSGL